MTTLYLPTDGSIDLSSYADGVQFDVQICSSRAGRITTRTLPGWRWKVRLAVAMHGAAGFAVRGRAEALLTSLRGGGNELAVWHPNKPLPLGSLRGTPALTAPSAAGASSITIAATTGTTLLAGDRLGLGGTVYLVAADTTSASGTMVISLCQPLRAAASVGQTLVLERPTVLVIPTEPEIMLPYQGAQIAPAIDLDLIEL
jgi:hypothetical protein